ncbi:MAG: hypothetical protein ACJAT7_003816, partial [Psychromonas sp.]
DKAQFEKSDNIKLTVFWVVIGKWGLIMVIHCALANR